MQSSQSSCVQPLRLRSQSVLNAVIIEDLLDHFCSNLSTRLQVDSEQMLQD